MRTIAPVTLATLLLAVGNARADDACRADVEKLCAGIPQGGGRIMACLKANQAQVSPACKAEMASVARMVKEVGTACADDVQSYCADMKPGQGAVVRCLAANKGSLAPACQDILQGAQEKVAEFKKACGKDAKKLCKGIRPGEGRVLACLKSKEAELSPACQTLVR
jgi:Cysteine rich repeat